MPRSNSFEIPAVVVPTITEYQPGSSLDLQNWDIPKNIKLADPNFNKRGRINILISGAKFSDLLSKGKLRLGDNSHIPQKTLLGWMISGGGVFSINSHSLATSCK